MADIDPAPYRRSPVNSSPAQIWRDGRLVPAAEATIPVLSHAVQRGSTVFDVLRVCGTDDGPAALGLRPHMARFERSMDLMGMEPAWTLDQLERAVAEVVAANPGTTLVKVSATWSSTPVATLPDTNVPEIWIAGLVAPMASPTEAIPARAVSARVPKMPADILPPGLKVAAAYTYGIRDKLAAVQQGADEIILRTLSGDLAESVSQSLFVVGPDGLVVPPLDTVLDGITRRLVLDVAHGLGHHTQSRPVHWDEVTGADELFLCSTTNPVLPVAALDDRDLVAPGPLTGELAAEVADVLSGNHELSRRWLTPLRVLAQ